MRTYLSSFFLPSAPGGGKRGGGTPGGRCIGGFPGRGLGAEPQLPRLRRRAAAMSDQNEERPDGSEHPHLARGQRLPEGPVQGHHCLALTPPPSPHLQSTTAL